MTLAVQKVPLKFMPPAVEMVNVISAGTGEDHAREGRVDYTDKSDLIREHDCYSVWPVFQYVLHKQSR